MNHIVAASSLLWLVSACAPAAPPAPVPPATVPPATGPPTPTAPDPVESVDDAASQPAKPEGTCEKKDAQCEHSELAKLIAQEWQIDQRPDNNAALLDAALRKGPLYVRNGGPEAFNPCIVVTAQGMKMALNKDAPVMLGGVEDAPSKTPCLIVYPDVESAASDCHEKPEEADIAQLAAFAAMHKMGISITCKQFTKTIYPEETANYAK